jgi:hypothetical protein
MRLHSSSDESQFIILQPLLPFYKTYSKMMQAPRAFSAVASQTRGCSRGAYNKPKDDKMKSIFASATKAVKRPRAPAPGPGFSVTVRNETLGHFFMAVCIMLVMYSVEEVHSNYPSQVAWGYQVRAGHQMPA